MRQDLDDALPPPLACPRCSSPNLRQHTSGSIFLTCDCGAIFIWDRKHGAVDARGKKWSVPTC